MKKRFVIIAVVLVLLGLTARLVNGLGGHGFAQTLRTLVHGQ